MTKVIFEQNWDEIDYDVEDSGMAVIYTMSKNDCDLFVRLQSWDETKEHLEFQEFMGQNIRITIEIID